MTIEYNPGLPEIILADIDGTIAHRRDDRGPYDWSRVREDEPDYVIMEIIQSFSIATGAEVIVFTGRDDECEGDTRQWLEENEFNYSLLAMRPHRDERKDSDLKRDLYFEHIHEKYNVLAVFDDRQQVVDMWRDLGLQVLQVAPGDF